MGIGFKIFEVGNGMGLKIRGTRIRRVGNEGKETGLMRG